MALSQTLQEIPGSFRGFSAPGLVLLAAKSSSSRKKALGHPAHQTTRAFLQKNPKVFKNLNWRPYRTCIAAQKHDRAYKHAAPWLH